VNTSGPPRLAAPAAVPVVTGALLAWHPQDPTLATDLASVTARWTTIHLGLLFAMPLLALLVKHLLRDVPGRAASISRTLVIPAAVLYAAFDVLVGLATGLLAERAAELPAGQRAGAQALVQWWWEVPPVVGVISGLAVASWAIAVALAARATHLAGFGRTVPVALLSSSLLFAAGHPGVTGALAMIALTTAIVAAEGSRKKRERSTWTRTRPRRRRVGSSAANGRAG
jgi:hypothetical protein